METDFLGKYSFCRIWAKNDKVAPKIVLVLFFDNETVDNERSLYYLFSSSNLISGEFFVFEFLHKTLLSSQIVGSF